MEAHFRAFSFVDRILSIEPEGRIHGTYTVPPQLKEFSTTLVAEAIGQLAAWAAMEKMDFQFRPVAGIAARVDMRTTVHPGQVVELRAELETVDTDAIAYHGRALVDGTTVIELEHCVGPMVRVEDFDDPDALRERFALLRDTGATAGAFNGLPAFPFEVLNGEAGQSITARFQVPQDAPFFGDHFPRRPVFPGTLLMKANLELAAALADQFSSPVNGDKWVLRGVSDLKLRAFTPPGEALEIHARLDQMENDAATVTVQTRNGKRGVGSARVHLALEKME